MLRNCPGEGCQDPGSFRTIHTYHTRVDGGLNTWGFAMEVPVFVCINDFNAHALHTANLQVGVKLSSDYQWSCITHIKRNLADRLLSDVKHAHTIRFYIRRIRVLLRLSHQREQCTTSHDLSHAISWGHSCKQMQINVLQKLDAVMLRSERRRRQYENGW